MNSRFMRAMFSSEISLGHSASQEPVLVQLPNPSSSICFTIFFARSTRSTAPWGNSASCDIFAETKSMAEEFLQEATQAPQPMQAAAAKASSASCLGTGRLFASCAFPVFTETKPPAAIMRSKAERATTSSIATGKPFARQGSMVMESPSLNARMCNWQVVVPSQGPCARPLMNMLHIPQMPSRQSWSNATGSSPLRMSCSLGTSIISRKDMSDEMSLTLYVTKLPASLAFFCLQIFNVRFIFIFLPWRPCVFAVQKPTAKARRRKELFIRTLCRMHDLKIQLLLMQFPGIVPFVFPRCHIGEVRIIAFRFTVLRL